MTDQLLVLALLLLPVAAAVVVWGLGPSRGPAIRAVSVAASVLMLLLALVLAADFVALERPAPEEGVIPTFRPEFVTTWNILPVGESNIQFYLGVDGLNIWLVVLTALLM